RVYAPGDAIAVQGQGGDSIFVLVAGKAEVARQGEGRNRILGFLGGGSIFGEISLLTAASPTATVAVRDATQVVEILPDPLQPLGGVDDPTRSSQRASQASPPGAQWAGRVRPAKDGEESDRHLAGAPADPGSGPDRGLAPLRFPRAAELGDGADRGSTLAGSV